MGGVSQVLENLDLDLFQVVSGVHIFHVTAGHI